MSKLTEEIREALKPHRVEGFVAFCVPMPTLQQMDQLITEVEWLSTVCARYENALEVLSGRCSDDCPCCQASGIVARDALAEAVRP